MDQKKIGSFLRELRKNEGLTQEQVAEKLGISSRTISRWETGAYMPDISMLVGIAEMYDVDVREIIDGERKEENMDSEVKEVAEKMADYSTMEKNNMLKWFKMMGIGTMIISLCLIILNFVRPFAMRDLMPSLEWRMIFANLLSPNALLMYVMLAFSLVVIVFASGKVQSIGQDSKTVKLTKLIIIASIIIAVAAVIESIYALWLYTQMG
ncbi:MAG: helix-turn-helix domain-containing protein [Eubacterium sp.]|nr:helix-turn-helix domain-containing protein [Eubacterium sp.]